jgi:hypothetical protein
MRQLRFVEASWGSFWVAAVMTPCPMAATIYVVPTLKQEGKYREQKTQVWCDRSNSDSARISTRRRPRRGRRNRQHFHCSKRLSNGPPGSFCTRATAVRDRHESICSVRHRSRSVRVGSAWIRIGFMTRPRTVTRSAASTRGAAGYAADASERKISAELNRMRRWRQLGDQREAELCNDRINDLLHRFRCGSGTHVGTRQTVVHLGV